MSQFTSFFVQTVAYDDRQRNARRYVSLPWVGVHAF